MSFQLMAWAVKQQTGSPTRKAVLLALANRTNHDTGRCDPSIEAICAETELGRTAAKNALAALAEMGLISRERKRRSDGSLGTYRYTLLGAGDGQPGAGDAPDPGAGDAPLNQEEDLEPGEISDPSDLRSQEPGAAPALRGLVPSSVDRVKVTEAEALLAIEILHAWNRLAGQSLRSKDWLSKIILRIREYPEATIQDHTFIIEQCLRFPWWKGPPTPSVIYGNGAQFERSVMTARQARGDDDRIERIVEAVIERSRAR